MSQYFQIQYSRIEYSQITLQQAMPLMMMLKWLTNGLVLLGCLLLAACGSGEQLLRSAVDDLEQDFVYELSVYTQFDAKQQQAVGDLSVAVKDWVKTQRLPQLRVLLIDMVQQLERQAVIEQQSYFDLFDLLQQLFSFSQSEPIMLAMADLAYSLNQQQVQQIEAKLSEEFDQLAQQSRGQTVVQENKKIAKVLRYVMRDLQAPVDSADRKAMLAILANRKPTIESSLQAEQTWNRALLTLFKRKLPTHANKALGKVSFQRQFIQLWRQSETMHEQADPVAWQYNRQLMMMALEAILPPIESMDRRSLIQRLQDYIAVLDDLGAT